MRGRLRVGTAAAVVVVLVAATGAPAHANTPNLDTYGVPGVVAGIAIPQDSYTATIPGGWWTGIGVAAQYLETGGYSEDYGLKVIPQGEHVIRETSPVALSGQDYANFDFVAVNTNNVDNGRCDSDAGSTDVIVYGLGPTNGKSSTTQTLRYAVWKTFPGRTIAPVPAAPTVVEVPADLPDVHPVSMVDIFLRAGYRYTFRYTPENAFSHGGYLLFSPGSPSSLTCVFGSDWAVTRAFAPVGSSAVQTTYTSDHTGWFGLALLTGSAWRLSVTMA